MPISQTTYSSTRSTSNDDEEEDEDIDLQKYNPTDMQPHFIILKFFQF